MSLILKLHDKTNAFYFWNPFVGRNRYEYVLLVLLSNEAVFYCLMRCFSLYSGKGNTIGNHAKSVDQHSTYTKPQKAMRFIEIDLALHTETKIPIYCIVQSSLCIYVYYINTYMCIHIVRYIISKLHTQTCYKHDGNEIHRLCTNMLVFTVLDFEPNIEIATTFPYASYICD